jgi:hypothetical protein
VIAARGVAGLALVLCGVGCGGSGASGGSGTDGRQPSAQRAGTLCQSHVNSVPGGSVGLVNATTAGAIVRLIRQQGTDQSQAALWTRLPADTFVATCHAGNSSAPPQKGLCPDGVYAPLPPSATSLAVDERGDSGLVTLWPQGQQLCAG